VCIVCMMQACHSLLITVGAVAVSNRVAQLLAAVACASAD
jgi:hypothetical protein